MTMDEKKYFMHNSTNLGSGSGASCLFICIERGIELSLSQCDTDINELIPDEDLQTYLRRIATIKTREHENYMDARVEGCDDAIIGIVEHFRLISVIIHTYLNKGHVNGRMRWQYKGSVEIHHKIDDFESATCEIHLIQKMFPQGNNHYEFVEVRSK